jgi:acyl-CoA dehydrogenase
LDFAVDESTVRTMREVTSKFDLSYWRDVCRRRAFPSEYWRAIGKAGLFGILLGKEWGGMEKGLVDLALTTEETARHYAGLGSYLFHSGALTPVIFLMIAGEAMKRKMVPALARGEVRVSIALAEEGSGLDALSITTTAKKSSDHYVVNGSKLFVTNADTADFVLLFARTKQGAQGSRGGGLSMFLVDPRRPGMKVEKLEKLGMDFNTMCSLEIEGLRVNSEDLVGRIDEAWQPMKEIFEKDRISTAASLVGTGWLALDLASAYAGKRMVFGKIVGSNQGVQFPLADAVAQLVAAEAMTLKAASRADRRRRYSDEANFSLLEAQSAAGAATDRALQAFGGHGYLRANDVERFWRDVRAHRFHPISEELLLSQIAKRALGLPASY